jgi:hypothetical protein
MLPIWEYLNNKLYDLMANEPVLVEFVPVTVRIKRAVWAECVWWGEPVKVPKADGRIQATSFESGRRRGHAVSPRDQEGQA